MYKVYSSEWNIDTGARWEEHKDMGHADKDMAIVQVVNVIGEHVRMLQTKGKHAYVEATQYEKKLVFQVVNNSTILYKYAVDKDPS